MFTPYQSTAAQRPFAFAVPVFIATWLISVPTYMATSNFVAAVALFTALGWVASQERTRQSQTALCRRQGRAVSRGLAAGE